MGYSQLTTRLLTIVVLAVPCLEFVNLVNSQNISGGHVFQQLQMLQENEMLFTD
jgi:hypothetical protein